MDYGPHTDGELIDLIYAALLGETTWQTFLDCLSGRAPDGRTVLFSHNMSQADEYLAMAARFEGPELEAYASHYVHVSPWLDHCALRNVGRGIYSDEIIPREELVRTEFYNDFLAPNDIACSIGVTFDKKGDCPLIVSTVTSRADPDLNSRFSEQLTRIAPHLQRAARFYRTGSTGWSGFDLSAPLFDAMDIGVVLVGENGRIKTVSPAGQEFLDSGAAVFVSPVGRLHFRTEDAHSLLKDMLKRNYDGQKTVSLVCGGTNVTLLRVEKDRISLYFEGPTVALLIEKAGNRPVELGQFILDYRLSMGEQRALRGIVEDRSPAQIAEQASVSRETVRSQLKSLYAKTGTSGQADLLRLVHGLRRSRLS